jgi:hypothetical protein
VDNSALLDLLRPLPAIDVALARTGHGQLRVIHILGDGRTGRSGCTAEISTGATSELLEPMNTSSPNTVLNLLAPS